MQGYNAGEIVNLLNTMNEAFNKVGEGMASNWGSVVTTMQSEWIGPDEQDFEGKLAERYVKLYTSCEEIVRQLLTNLIEIGKSWVNMQNENKLDGDGFRANTITSFGFENIPTINTYDIASIVKLQERVFTQSDNMGLQNGAASGTSILEKINQYNDDLKANIQGLFGQVDTSKAFLDAQQADAISSYISEVGNYLKSINSDVDDMTMHLSKLAGTSYEEMVQSVAQAMGKAASDVAGQIRG